MVLLLAGACSPDDGDEDTSSGPPVDTVAADSEADAGPTDTSEVVDTVVADTGDDSGSGPVDTNKKPDTAAPVDVAVDAGPECQVAGDCAGKITPKVCEELACLDGGVCGVTIKANTCCLDKHCDDKVDCTTDKCNTDNNTCSNTTIPNCCGGKVTLLKGDFEQGSWSDLVAKEGASNGNVKWQLSDKRSHGGKSSLYFGNECGTYDNAMSANESCVPVKDKGTAVSTVLSSKTFTLDKTKQTQLHFWLWLDSEPPYSTTLPKGDCSGAPCKSGQSCVSVSGKSQCIPEKDVLSVQVLSSKGGAKKVFDSTMIGKTTDGKWHRVAVNLTEFKDQAVTIQWLFASGTAIKNNHEGIYLDDIVLETVCDDLEGTLCIKDKPCLDDGNACTEDACTFYVNTPQMGVCFHGIKPDCCSADGDCSDGNDCTADTCVEGKCSYAPDATKPGCCKKKILAVDDFESGVLDQWTLAGGNSNSVKWRIDPKGGNGKSQALYFGNNTYDSYADDSVKEGGPKGMACIKPVGLVKGTVFNLVTFKLRLETEWSWLPAAQYKNPPLAGKPKYDHFSVVVDVGGKKEEAWSSDLIHGTTEGKWVDVVASVDGWQGQQVTVCLSFDAGDGKVNDKVGVHVDDFAIKVACDKKPCYFDAECGGTCPTCEAPGCTATGCKCVKVEGCCKINDDCDDKNPCTKEFCNAGTCKVDKLDGCCQEDADCVSQDACKTAVCDKATTKCAEIPITGCCVEDKDCDDKDACTKDSCDIPKSSCVHDKITGCCKEAKDCDDQDKCTTDTCEQNACKHAPSGEPGC